MSPSIQMIILWLMPPILYTMDHGSCHSGELPWIAAVLASNLAVRYSRMFLAGHKSRKLKSAKKGWPQV